MKIITSYTLQVTRYILMVLRSYGLTVLLLSVLAIANAQVDVNRILDSATLKKNELKMTPELEKMVVKGINNMPEGYLSTIYGINKEQLENLQIGKPIPCYRIVNKKLEPVFAPTVHRLADGDTLSLRFLDKWNVPVMSSGVPLAFAEIRDGGNRLGDFGYTGPRNMSSKIENAIEHICNYEHKDLLIGSFEASPSGNGMDFLIIRKEDKDIFVEVYDEATGEYFKNEYGSGELITLLTDLFAKIKAKQSRYYDFVADKSELILTPELTEMLCTRAFSHTEGWSDEMFSSCGIKNRPKLENLHPGKPVPKYRIVNENLIFTGSWEVPVMSDGELPFYVVTVNLKDNGQYSDAGGGSANYEEFNNYKYKDLLIGYLTIGSTRFFIIRKDNTDIFVKAYDWNTGEYYKTEYSLSEIINLFKK